MPLDHLPFEAYLQDGVLGLTVVALGVAFFFLWKTYQKTLRQLNQIQEIRVNEAKEVIGHVTIMVEHYKDALNASTNAINNLKEVISMLVPHIRK